MAGFTGNTPRLANAIPHASTLLSAPCPTNLLALQAMGAQEGPASAAPAALRTSPRETGVAVAAAARQVAAVSGRAMAAAAL